MRRSVLLVWISLLLAALACARGEVPITPATPPAAAPVTLAPVPTGTAASGYPGPGAVASPAAPSPEPPTATAPASGYPAATIIAPPTVALSQPPPLASATTAPTATPLAPTATAPAAATATSLPATATPAPASATPAPAASGPRPIPANAQFTQAFTVSNEGGELIGVPADMRDGRPETWASLRNGPAAWVLELEAARTVAGLRVYAQRDFRDPTTLTKIEVSGDGVNWVAVYVGGGDCGVPQCDTLPQKVFTDLGFEARPARYIRLTGGPTRFAFGEIEVAVLP